MGFIHILLMGLGGALGSVLRGGFSHFLQTFSPWPTLLVNLGGAVLIGFLTRIFAESANQEYYKAFWIVGVCGGFTTFSTFGMDLFNLIKIGAWMHSALYACLSLGGTLGGIYIGYRSFSLIYG